MTRTFLSVTFLAILPITSVAQVTGERAQSATGRQLRFANLMPDAPKWLKDFNFPQSRFTFVRIQYDSPSGRGSKSWATDYPEAELNFVELLGRLTMLPVRAPRVMRLTDPAVAGHNILYLAEPGRLSLHDEEISALRKYLDAGGFLWIDDFWGEAELQNVVRELKRVYPDREPVDLPLSHPLFHCVFDLKAKPQVLTIHAFVSGRKSERVDAPEAHYRAVHDRRGRIAILMCHNTDLADGWENVGLEETYAREMSGAKAFPMGINIVFFALTQPRGD